MNAVERFRQVAENNSEKKILVWKVIYYFN